MAAIPDALIDTVSLCGPPDVIRERLAVYRDAGVGTLGVTPTAVHRSRAPRAAAAARRARRLTHRDGVRCRHCSRRATEADAARRLRRPRSRVPDDRARARARRTRTRRHGADVAALAGDDRVRGIDFAPAPEYRCSPQDPSRSTSTRRSCTPRATRGHWCASCDPTSSSPTSSPSPPRSPPSSTARRCATLIPHVYPHGAPESPIYSLGARMPRTALGRSFWRQRSAGVGPGLERGRRELNDTRAQLGLAPLGYVHNGISRELALVGDVPPARVSRAPGLRTSHVVGPLMWEPPASEVELPPPGDAPLVLSPPPPRRTPSTRCCGPRCAGSPTRRCVCSPHTTGDCRRARCRCPTTRASSSGSPTRARCRSATSSSATRATGRSCVRCPRAVPSLRARPSAT